MEIKILKKRFLADETTLLPPIEEGVYYIVSAIVATAIRRNDLIVPNTIRDEDGQIIGCDSFLVITGNGNGKVKEIFNLTPHDITVICEDKEITISKSLQYKPIRLKEVIEEHIEVIYADETIFSL